MDKYILKYKKSDGIKRAVHRSWYKTCEEQTKDVVIEILKKHLYDPGEYTLRFYAVSDLILRKKDQNVFLGLITQKNNKDPGGITSVGSIQFDYYEDTFDACDFKSSWLKIDCKTKLLNPTAKFTVAHECLMPSPREFEISCKKSAEQFVKRMHKSVSFPLEITCDYPDVIFEIYYDSKPDEKLIAETAQVIEDYATKYNKRHEDRIHNVAEIGDIMDSPKSNAVYIHVDFGNCGIEVLALVLREIGKSNLPIKQIILK